jgi:hypothetical protein
MDLSFNRYTSEPSGVIPTVRDAKNFLDRGGKRRDVLPRYMSADETNQNVEIGEKTKCSLTRHNKLP